MGDALNSQEATISYKTRSSRQTRSSAHGPMRPKGRNPMKAGGRGAKKGLSADGSTRAWRKVRNALPGKPRRCPDGRPPFVNHKKARRLGGTDNPRNLEWGCGHNPGTGRPRKSAPRSHFSAANRARGRRA